MKRYELWIDGEIRDTFDDREEAYYATDDYEDRDAYVFDTHTGERVVGPVEINFPRR